MNLPESKKPYDDVINKWVMIKMQGQPDFYGHLKELRGDVFISDFGVIDNFSHGYYMKTLQEEVTVIPIGGIVHKTTKKNIEDFCRMFNYNSWINYLKHTKGE